jgi:galactose mutarotase-like enzyme
VAVELALSSEDGDHGFPGRLELQVRYTLTPGNEWRIDYRAVCDRATALNLTHHAYWNLRGSGSALGHRLQLAASRFLAVGRALIPEQRSSTCRAFARAASASHVERLTPASDAALRMTFTSEDSMETESFSADMHQYYRIATMVATSSNCQTSRRSAPTAETASRNTRPRWP